MYIVVGFAFLAGIMFLFKMRVDEFKGEEAFSVYLKRLAEDGYLIENLILENQTRVPYLFLSKAGLFNIYYNPELLGRLYGDEEETTWTQVMEVRKIPVVNPVRIMEKQRSAWSELNDVIGKELPVYELICLSKRATPKLNISVPIVSLERLVEEVESKEACLTSEEVEQLVEKIKTIDA